MLRASPSAQSVTPDFPTLWGLDPVELHDRFWAARSVCVVRPGSSNPLPRKADLYMLTDVRTLTLFRLSPIVEKLFWARPAVIFVRFKHRRHEEYRESVITDAEGRFQRFARHYDCDQVQVARIALTRDRRIAELWQETDGSPSMWRSLRQQTRGKRRQALVADGSFYDRSSADDLDRLVANLITQWPYPAATIEGIREIQDGVWANGSHRVPPGTLFLGPAWIGAGRSISPGETVLGPAALWDDATQRPDPNGMRWDQLDPTVPQPRRIEPRQVAPWRRRSKRCFDIVFALAALLVTLPLYPFIMLAIWLEDGGPFIFAHKRETLGGREFPCLKFRSMRKDADRIKAQLLQKNQSDGPQFFIEQDPRVTRVGRFLRRTNLDEIPQFINVLIGHMSVVGPRPSPRSENQCCPPWREARLSVRPGITGLWQVSRTRREGLDFQEWIQFDVEYVERAGWRLDLLIICKTIRLLVGR